MLHYMLVATMSISAVAGGNYVAERLLDRFARIPQPFAIADMEPAEGRADIRPHDHDARKPPG